MATPRATETIPQRVLDEYAVGTKRTKPPFPAGVPAPARVTTNPSSLVLWDNQYSYAYTTSAAIASGQAITITQQVPLSDVPPLLIDPPLSLYVHVVPWVQHGVAGLCLQSLQTVALAASGQVVFQGRVFAGGTIYSSFAVLVTVSLYNATAASIPTGQSITLWLDVVFTVH
jgi:hypothetical protein